MNNLARSRPWKAEEKLIINGFSLVYTPLADGDMMIRIPGQRRALLSDLAKAGMRIAMPAQERRR